VSGYNVSELNALAALVQQTEQLSDRLGANTDLTIREVVVEDSSANVHGTVKWDEDAEEWAFFPIALVSDR
jgi:hypothetical protein